MRGKKPLIVLVAILLAVSAAAPAALAAAQSETTPDGINNDADAVPDGWINADVTKDVHQMGWSPLEYEADDGSVATLDARVNDTENPVSYVATDVNASEFGEFPRKSETDNEASALDASEWSSDASAGGSLSVSDVTTAPGVDAVSISTSSQAAGDTVVATYSNFSITSDADKRYLQLAADVNTLDSGAVVEIRAVDADGDYKSVFVDSSNATSSDDTLANATGEGQVLQVQLGTLTTEGSGDGTFAEIQKLEVRVNDADADMDFALINAEKMGEYDFGQQAYDEDGDGDKDETQTLREPNGRVAITGFDTLGTIFGSAMVHDAEVDAKFHTADVTEAMDVHWNTSAAAAYPGFETRADVYFRLSLPDAYDLSYSGAELVGDQELPDDRYQAVEISEGVSDTEFENVSSWTDKTSTYSSMGEHQLDGTIQPGQEIALHFDVLWTADDESSAFSSGGAGGQFESDSGGILSTIYGKIAGLFGAVLVALGLKRKRG